MTIGLGRTEVETWEITIADMEDSGLVAHGLGFTPDTKNITFKPKTGTDVGASLGDITVTSNSTNIILTTLSPPLGGDWVFEVLYIEGL